MTSSSAPEDRPATRWMSSLVPYSMVSGTVGTLVQLYILELGGTVLQVGFAITLYSAVAIPAAVFWGSVSDRLKRRRPTIVASFATVGLLVLLFLLSRSVIEVSIVYAAYSFTNSAPTTPINLLILETQTKSRWASSYARYQVLASVGNILGLLASSILSVFVPVSLLVVFLSLCSLTAASMAARLISEPAFLLEGTAQAKHYLSILQRLVTQPLVFLKTPRPIHLRNTFRILRSDFTGHVRTLYVSLLVFYFATGLTLVAFVPLLRAKGLSDPLVFAVSTINLVVMAASFWYFGPRMKRTNFVRYSFLSLVLRAVSYASVGLVAYLLTGVLFDATVVLFSSLASGLAAGVYYTTSTGMIYESLGVDDQGSSLGIYTAFTGVCLTLGEFVAGYVTFYSAYYVTFLLTGAAFALCAWITLTLRSTPFGSG